MVQRLMTFTGAWLVLLAVGMAVVATLGLKTDATTWLVLAAIAFVPPFIVLFLWRDSAPMTVAELIHDVEHRTR